MKCLRELKTVCLGCCAVVLEDEADCTGSSNSAQPKTPGYIFHNPEGGSTKQTKVIKRQGEDVQRDHIGNRQDLDCVASILSCSVGGPRCLRESKVIIPAKEKQMSGGNQPAAKRARRNLSNDGPVTLHDLPPDAARIVFAYALPLNDEHKLEFVGIMGAVCRSFRKFVRTVWAPWLFDLERYREYTPLAGPDREPRDCRLALLKSLAKTPSQRRMIYRINIIRSSLESEPSMVVDGSLRLGRISNAILSALRSLLAMKGAFPTVTTIFIDLTPLARWGRQDTNVKLINKRILKKVPSSFPRLTHVRFGHCLDPDTLLAGNLVKFFQALEQPPKFLSLVNIPFLEEYHVAKILRCIGRDLTHLQIVGGGVNGNLMYTGTANEGGNNCMYDALSTNCRQLQVIELWLMVITTENLGKVLDLEETLTELTLQGNDYVAFDGEVEGDEAEEFVAGLFENKGKNLKHIQCDFRRREFGGTALRNIIALQKRMATTFSGADAGDDNGNANGNRNEGASQKEIKLRTAILGQCPIEELCFAVSAGVRTIDLLEWPEDTPNLEEVRTYFRENDVSIPSGITLVIDNTSYDLQTGMLK